MTSILHFAGLPDFSRTSLWTLCRFTTLNVELKILFFHSAQKPTVKWQAMLPHSRLPFATLTISPTSDPSFPTSRVRLRFVPSLFVAFNQVNY